MSGEDLQRLAILMMLLGGFLYFGGAPSDLGVLVMILALATGIIGLVRAR